jgi:hypothetical protein
VSDEVAYDATHVLVWLFVALAMFAGSPELAALIGVLMKGGDVPANKTKKANLNRVQNSTVKHFSRFLLLLSLSVAVQAEEKAPDIVPPYQVPTFTGEETDWHKMKPAINPAKTVNADLIVETVNHCYPVPPMNIEISLRSGATYKPPTTGAMALHSITRGLWQPCLYIRALKSTKSKNWQLIES